MLFVRYTGFNVVAIQVSEQFEQVFYSRCKLFKCFNFLISFPSTIRESTQLYSLVRSTKTVYVSQFLSLSKLLSVTNLYSQRFCCYPSCTWTISTTVISNGVITKQLERQWLPANNNNMDVTQHKQRRLQPL